MGAAVGLAAGGCIFDLTGGYGAAFLTATLTMFISAMLLPVKRKSEQARMGLDRLPDVD